ncbi:MAG TPA: hypothetical protein VF407_20420, partial [Polyangiaceae bacterium]
SSNAGVPMLSHTEIDKQVAASFARAHGATPPPAKVAEKNETMGATHSTMPGLSNGKGKTWMLLALLGIVVFAAALGSIKLLQKKELPPPAAAPVETVTPTPTPTPTPNSTSTSTSTPTPTPTANSNANPSAVPSSTSAPTSTSTHRHHGTKPPPPAETAHGTPGSGL